MPYILQTSHLTKTIGGRTLIRDVNLHVNQGEIYGLLGPNGAGKTTIMKLVTNLWKPTSGTVELFGGPLTPKSYEVLKRMGSIIEFPTFYDHLSGLENLRLHCEYMGYYNHGAIDQALELLSLMDAAGEPVKTYSLGMRERLGIARAILCKPELLILDEPTTGLDPAGMRQIRRLLKTLRDEQGITILISSHLLSEIEGIADTIGVIHRGCLIKEASMKTIKEQNMACIELSADNTKKACFLLSDRLGLSNFKVVDEGLIRIYEPEVSTEEISKLLALNGVGVSSLSRKSETLEDYFLKLTKEEDKNGKAH